MNSNLKFSVIVPVYNVEQYLEECLDSILIQDYPNFELIVVDDGSPDNSPAICDRYAEQDRRIRVIHQENRRLGGARNSGMDIATGDYIIFIDSDDTVRQGYFSALAKMIESSDEPVDLIYAPIPMTDIHLFPKRKYNNQEIRDEIFAHFLGTDNFKMPTAPSACSLCINRKFMGEVRFPLIYCIEDKPFFLELMLRCNNLLIRDEDFYNYRINHNSLSRTYNPKTLPSYIESNELVLDVLRRYKADTPQNMKAFDHTIVAYYFHIIRREAWSDELQTDNPYRLQYYEQFGVKRILTWTNILTLMTKSNMKFLYLKLGLDKKLIEIYWKREQRKRKNN